MKDFFEFYNEFYNESSSWVEIRLHTEFGQVWLSRSCEKVTDGFGVVVVWFVVS